MQNRKSWNRRDGYELRLTNKTIGYLNANAREFLFSGNRSGEVAFERMSNKGAMSLIAKGNGLKVNKQGHLAVTTFTSIYPALELPKTILLAPFEDERRLIISGVK